MYHGTGKERFFFLPLPISPVLCITFLLVSRCVVLVVRMYSQTSLIQTLREGAIESVRRINGVSVFSSLNLEKIKSYYINTIEIPSELSCENVLSSHVKISPLLWLNNKSRLSHQNTIKVKWLVVHWCLYNIQHSKRNFVSPRGPVISSINQIFIM